MAKAPGQGGDGNGLVAHGERLTGPEATGNPQIAVGHYLEGIGLLRARQAIKVQFLP